MAERRGGRGAFRRTCPAGRAALALALVLGLAGPGCRAQAPAAGVAAGAAAGGGTGTPAGADAGGAAFSPEADGERLWRVDGDFTHLAPDGLGNTYVVSAQGDIRRYDERGRLMYRVSEVRFGPVGGLDAANPLRILVYYPEFLTALLLSNTLGVAAEVDLRRRGFNRVRAMGLARDGRLWAYDEINFQLVKFDDRGNEQRRSEPLNYVLGLELRPVRLVERNDRLYLHDPVHGILVFDVFGTYEYRFGGPGIRAFQVFPEGVVYERADGTGALHDPRSGFERPFALPGEPATRRAWRLDRDRVLLLTPAGLEARRAAP